MDLGDDKPQNPSDIAWTLYEEDRPLVTQFQDTDSHQLARPRAAISEPHVGPTSVPSSTASTHLSESAPFFPALSSSARVRSSTDAHRCATFTFGSADDILSISDSHHFASVSGDDSSSCSTQIYSSASGESTDTHGGGGLEKMDQTFPSKAGSNPRPAFKRGNARAAFSQHRQQGSFYLGENDDTITPAVHESPAEKVGRGLKMKRRGSELSSSRNSSASAPLPNSPTSDDVFSSNGQPLAHDRNRVRHASGQQEGATQNAMKDSLMVILSGLYGILLVVLGLILPLAETFTKTHKVYRFELFYIYLYCVSMVFLLYVYTYLLRKEKTLLSITRRISRTFSRSQSVQSPSSSQPPRKHPLAAERGSSGSGGGGGASQYPSVGSSSGAAPGRRISSTGTLRPLLRQNSWLSTVSGRGKRKKIAFDSRMSHHTGSFYLRVGVIAFGIGSMIHSSLTFGYNFEIHQRNTPCSNILQAIKPFMHLIFTFVQMYFVFMNSKMCVHKYKSLARFGLMHMSGTNICVWLRSIVVETLQVINMEKRKNKIAEADKVPDSVGNTISELNCQPDAMMGRLVEKSSVYLYPCTIEYSLVCACVLYIMWSNVGGGATPNKPRSRHESYSDMSADPYDDTEDDDNDDVDDADDLGQSHRMSVDCTGSSQGLFSGILLFVVAVVCLVCFYVLIGTEKHLTTGTILGHISEDFIYLVALIATIVAAFQMRSMHYGTRVKAGIEEILTVISLSGLVLFGMFSIVASVFYLHTLNGVMTILTNVCMIVQAGAQATFTLTALRASAADGSQVREKPGRQFVTFLLVSNFALWVINTFETQTLEHNPIQVQFYGASAWSIFSHISVPLGIYFRFHSTVSLSNVWKKAWKRKHMKRVGLQNSTQSAL